MRRWLLPLLLGVLLPALAAAAEAADALLHAFLDDLGSLRAEFRQTVTDAQGRIVEQAEGTLVIARPGRFRWDYRIPEQLIVCDGTTLWLYDPELAQVTVRAAGTALAGTPALLLAGSGRIEDQFAVSDAGAAGGLSWRLLAPRGDGDFREVRLGFAAAELRRMQLVDRLGQRTEVEFSALQRNPALDPALFVFTPPAGVDVIGRAPGS